MPVWQNAFVLGPNVRFTRTPEAALSKRPGPETTAPQPAAPHAGLTANAPEVAIHVPAPVAAPTPPMVYVPRPEPRIAKPLVLPQPEDAKGARALTYRLRRELARQQQAAEMAANPELASGAEPAAEMTPDAVAPIPATEVQPVVFATEPVDVPRPSFMPSAAAFLSDHAFWETMGLDLDAVPPSVAAPVNTDVASAPTVAIAAPHVVLAPLPPIGQSAFEEAGLSVVAFYRQVIARNLASPPQLEAPAPTAAVEPATLPQTIDTAPIAAPLVANPVAPAPAAVIAPVRSALRNAPVFHEAPALSEGEYQHPPVDLLQKPQVQQTTIITPEALEQSAGLLESVLEDFGIKGEMIDVRPGPVVTLYEFEPAPGVKSSRVIGLSDDIARSMSALSARVAVIPGRNVIGIELPNPVRETVYLRELIESQDYAETRFKLPVCLGKTIGGEAVIAELAKMPHLLVAGTTGSGKSVAINTMILSLLYRFRPDECRLIMVDPKMLELSVYDGIPHLLTPVVTDPKKAVMALKWAVREMEDRYRKMSRLGVRNIDGYNARAATARAKGETILCSVQTGFDRSSGEPIFEQEEMDLTPMPYIVVIVDEMADLMMVAGKEIEGAIQRLAQMARAAGIHIIMATQRPSVDVITGTIKANFPTRVSFQVTSKIDSRTILGEPGAEHLLGQGDMLHMIGGGRIARVHGPFVSDEEVEKVVAHLKTQGRPEYLGTVTEDADEAAEEVAEEDTAVFDKTAMGDEDASDLYEKAVKVVMRDKKCSTSYIQRRLSIGYNKAASLVERMEQEGLVGPANHVGKRAIIAGSRDMHDVSPIDRDD
ncbi:DNA translocase FtsK [Rhizobium sp. RU36D]|nr:DNA translocase FtsK [Rhizobium sp. RU36D]